MGGTAREEILKKLGAAQRERAPARPSMPTAIELSWDSEKLIEKFTENVTEQTGVVHRAKDHGEVIARLAEIAREENLTKVMVSTDDVIVPLDLKAWGQKENVAVLEAADFTGREAFKDAVFDEVQAGITGADYAVAESGTLCIIHDKNQPRLASLAPITHIAILPIERLLPLYESVIDRIFSAKEENPPSQTTFITGPSMTGDIQGIPFKGMHGPKRLFVILIG